MKALFFITGCLLSFSGFCQPMFQKTISAPGNQNAVAAMQSASDDYYILSETDSGQNNSKDFLLIKMNAAGSVLWSKYFGTAADDVPTDIKQMSNGKIMMCGYAYLGAGTDADVYVICIDTAGIVQWSKGYGGAQNDYAFKMVATTSDSSVVIAGQTSSFGTVSTSGYVLKIAANGSITWSLTSNLATYVSNFNSIDKTFDGNYIVAGTVPIGTVTSYIIKLSDFGTVLSSVFVNGPTGYILKDIKAIPGGDFLITGIERTSATDTGSVLLFRVNPSALSVSFVKHFFTFGYEKGNSALVTPDGNLAVIGNNFTAGIQNGFFSKIGLAGNLLFTVNYCPGIFGSFSSLNSAIVCNDNTILMVGSASDTIGFQSDIYLVKILLTGSSGCNETPSSFNSAFIQYGIGLGSNNNFGGIASTVVSNASTVNVVENNFCWNAFGLEEASGFKGNLSIYPNPATQQITLSFSQSLLSAAHIRVFNLLGEQVYQQYSFIQKQITIPVYQLPAGMYIMEVSYKGKKERLKFVRE